VYASNPRSARDGDGVYKSLGWLIRATRIDWLLASLRASARRPCLLVSLTLAIGERLMGTCPLASHSKPPSIWLVFPEKDHISFPHVLPRSRRVVERKSFCHSLAVLLAAGVTKKLYRKTVRRKVDAIAITDYPHCDRGSNGDRLLACGKWGSLRCWTTSTLVLFSFRGCQDRVWR
jgi:hypothetical protein